MIPDLLREYQDIGLIKIRTSLGQTNVLFDLGVVAALLHPGAI